MLEVDRRNFVVSLLSLLALAFSFKPKAQIEQTQWLDQYLGDYQLGLRPDGVVVWRR